MYPLTPQRVESGQITKESAGECAGRLRENPAKS